VPSVSINESFHIKSLNLASYVGKNEELTNFILELSPKIRPPLRVQAVT